MTVGGQQAAAARALKNRNRTASPITGAARCTVRQKHSNVPLCVAPAPLTMPPWPAVAAEAMSPQSTILFLLVLTMMHSFHAPRPQRGKKFVVEELKEIEATYAHDVWAFGVSCGCRLAMITAGRLSLAEAAFAS